MLLVGILAPMTPEIEALEHQIDQLKEELAKARRAAPREVVDVFEFESPAGKVTLSQLFGDRDELVVIHNMGESCPYCTLWADGFNGLARHFESRSAFVVCSPDPVALQQEFAASRNWAFTMVSDVPRTFTAAMGYWKEGGLWPGASAFVKEAGKVYRTGKVVFGPGDDFCGIWPMMDLLGGPKGWEPS